MRCAPFAAGDDGERAPKPVDGQNLGGTEGREIRPGAAFSVSQESRDTPEGQDVGGMAEWSKAAVLKTAERKLRGFESYSLRQFLERWPSG